MPALARENVVAAVKKSVSWLLGEQQPDGSIKGEVPSYYKLPGIFQMTGHHAEASALLDWIVKNALGPDGWFRYDASNYKDLAGARRWTTYQNEWLTLGSHLLGRFDVSRRALETLLACQDTAWGGFSYDRNIQKAAGETEALSTGFGGLACLFTGRLREARCAGDFFVKLLSLQPEPDQKLYLTVNTGKGLMTDYPEGEALMYVVDASREGQFYFFPGLMMAFLAKLYDSTSEEKYLACAKRLMGFSVRCQPDVYASIPSIKLGWGAAALFRITGDQTARRVAERIAAYVLETQNVDGTWYKNEYLGDPEGSVAEYSHRMDLTAEFTVRLIEMSKDLSL